MTTPVFPVDLPDVWTNQGSPTAQVLSGTDDTAPLAFRRLSRNPSAKSQVTWTFLEGEYKIFVAFFRDQLLFGHKWFYLRLPTALGFQYCVVRCSEVYTANQTGFDKWDVSLSLYIRERPVGGFDSGPLTPSDRPDNIELREDGGYELREDGGYELRD